MKPKRSKQSIRKLGAMVFYVDGQGYKIQFKRGYSGLPSNRAVLVQVTWCWIAYIARRVDPANPGPREEAIAHMGCSWCHPNDSFNRETGRKLALTRTLQPHTKRFRTVAWNAYLARGQDPTNL